MTEMNEAGWIAGPSGSERTGLQADELQQTSVVGVYTHGIDGPSHDIYGWTETRAVREGLTVFPVLDQDMRFIGTVAARSQADAFSLIPPRHGIDLRDLDEDEVARQIQGVLDMLPTPDEEGSQQLYGHHAVDGEGQSIAGQPVPYEAIEQE